MAKVLIEGVCKTYPGEKGREVTVVEDINLEVESEEFMVFVGPSGCGKSTTLRMIAGIEEITSGSIYIDGKRVNDVAPKDRDIAMVFQNYALYPHLSVYRNMAFALELRKFPKSEIESRVREAAQILGLTAEMLTRKPRDLSGGQRQRVALGRAIVRKPKVFLFDEPLSNLDAKMRVQMRAEISRLHHGLATTMIYVTHDQVEAMTMGDRICLMKDGRIQQVAVPMEIYNQPANMFVAAFIGSPSMNFFEGSLVEKQGRFFFTECGKKEGANAFHIEAAGEHAAKLAPWLNRKLFLGLRPENIELAATISHPHPDQIMEATLEVIEPMGAETFLYFTSGSHDFIVRSPQQQVTAKPGDRMQLLAHMKKAHFFDAADPAAYKKATQDIDVERWQTACRLIV